MLRADAEFEKNRADVQMKNEKVAGVSEKPERSRAF